MRYKSDVCNDIDKCLNRLVTLNGQTTYFSPVTGKMHYSEDNNDSFIINVFKKEIRKIMRKAENKKDET